MGTGVVMQDHKKLCDHAWILSLDSGMKVSEGSTTALCTDGDVRVLERQHQQPNDFKENNSFWTNSATGMPAFIHGLL
jgi:hypothetical protein